MEVVHQKSQCVRQGELNPLSDLRVSRRSGWASVWVPTTLTPAVTDWRIKRCLRIGVLQPLIGSMFGPWRRLTTDKSGEARTSIGALVAGAGALEGGVSGGSKGPAQIAVHFFFTLCLIGEFKAIRTPVHVPKSRTAESMEEAMEAAADIGRFPLIIRPAFTCGGTGGGIAYNVDEYKQIVKEGLDASMTNQVGVILVETSLIGWKEYELEVMRDLNDNVVIICSIENVDPMGVHTACSTVRGDAGRKVGGKRRIHFTLQASQFWGPVIGGPVSKMPASGGTTSNRPVSSGLASSRPASGAPVRNGPAWVNLLVVGLQVAYSYTIVYYAFSSLHALAELRIPRAHVWGNQLGDSITVAPSQTLTDKEYQRLRDAAIAIIREMGVECGGSNVQRFLLSREWGCRQAMTEGALCARLPKAWQLVPAVCHATLGGIDVLICMQPPISWGRMCGGDASSQLPRLQQVRSHTHLRRGKTPAPAWHFYLQMSINPADGDMIIIEMNPRVSRSSALASKATGFPIAKMAAKLSVGYTLDQCAGCTLDQVRLGCVFHSSARAWTCMLITSRLVACFSGEPVVFVFCLLGWWKRLTAEGTRGQRGGLVEIAVAYSPSHCSSDLATEG
eukprot:881020-Pelagomonas_calceolata.AAC.3